MAEDINLAGRLARWARIQPERIAVRFEDDTISYGELDRRVDALAAGLSAAGVRAGEFVCVLFDTSIDYVATWLALTRLGAVEAPINTGFRGPGLAHALRLTGASRLLVDATLAPEAWAALADVPAVREVFVRGGPSVAPPGASARAFAFEELLQGGGTVPPADVRPGDTTMLLFTSGSTGPSKACSIPNRYVLRQPEIFCQELQVGRTDTLYAPFPLFHADGAIFTVAAALAAGATAALAPKFSVRGFWDDCRRHEATHFDFMGATLAMLFKQPPGPRDRDHGLRIGWGVPSPPWAEAFEARFGVELLEVYGLSDAGIVLYNRPGAEKRTGSCGRPAEPFDLRLQDGDGAEVAAGEVGELVIRPREPHLVLNGYHGDPAATADAFRDLWFHTGDLMRRDADDFFYFVGRLKDVIRRRGENISAFDVEQALLTHPDVLEVAAYGVPSELTEEDLMVSVRPRAGAALAAGDVVDWAAGRLASHMVPRYVRLCPELPRTETEKVAKHLLKALGVTPDTHDFDPRAATRAPQPETTPNAD
ncbi:MAG: ATP-dependent acyl-CoA ligase [Phenylobacterium zucineum]|nr:MAG: ATP-dependent acyl-CoA ligase [Phenylobacterium zucineum]